MTVMQRLRTGVKIEMSKDEEECQNEDFKNEKMNEDLKK